MYGLIGMTGLLQQSGGHHVVKSISGSRQSRHDGSDRAGKMVGNLEIAQVAIVSQLENVAIAIGHRRQGLSHLTEHLP